MNDIELLLQYNCICHSEINANFLLAHLPSWDVTLGFAPGDRLANTLNREKKQNKRY